MSRRTKDTSGKVLEGEFIPKSRASERGPIHVNAQGRPVDHGTPAPQGKEREFRFEVREKKAGSGSQSDNSGPEKESNRGRRGNRTHRDNSSESDYTPPHREQQTSRSQDRTRASGADPEKDLNDQFAAARAESIRRIKEMRGWNTGSKQHDDLAFTNDKKQSETVSNGGSTISVKGKAFFGTPNFSNKALDRMIMNSLQNGWSEIEAFKDSGKPDRGLNEMLDRRIQELQNQGVLAPGLLRVTGPTSRFNINAKRERTSHVGGAAPNPSESARSNRQQGTPDPDSDPTPPPAGAPAAQRPPVEQARIGSERLALPGAKQQEQASSGSRQQEAANEELYEPGDVKQGAAADVPPEIREASAKLRERLFDLREARQEARAGLDRVFNQESRAEPASKSPASPVSEASPELETRTRRTPVLEPGKVVNF